MTKKEQIVEAAIILFARDGYEKTSIQKLAEETGVAQGLLYRHFKNKEDLLLHLLNIGLVQVQYTLEPYADKNLDFKIAFKSHIKRSFDQIQKHNRLWKILHAVRQNETLMASLGLGADLKEHIVKPMSNKLKADGYKQADMHAWFVFSMVDGVTSLYLAHPDVYPLSKMEKFLIEKIDNYVN